MVFISRLAVPTTPAWRRLNGANLIQEVVKPPSKWKDPIYYFLRLRWRKLSWFCTLSLLDSNESQMRVKWQWWTFSYAIRINYVPLRGKAYQWSRTVPFHKSNAFGQSDAIGRMWSSDRNRGTREPRLCKDYPFWGCMVLLRDDFPLKSADNFGLVSYFMTWKEWYDNGVLLRFRGI